MYSNFSGRFLTLSDGNENFICNETFKASMSG